MASSNRIASRQQGTPAARQSAVPTTVRRRFHVTNALVEYLGGLTLAGGDRDGELLTVLRWEQRFVRGAFSTPGDSALSVGRGNGKSALVAGLACAVADPSGPLHGNRREVVCVASSFTQAKVVFEDCLAMLRVKTGLGRSEWRTQDSQNAATITHRSSGARIRCIGSDPKRMHGLRPALALLDEPAQWDAARADRMLAGIRTGLGKVPGSRLVALGTRPATSGHFFAKMLAPGGCGYAQTHAARPDDPPFRLSTIRRANPSFGHLPSLRERIAIEARDAKRDPELLASFRALRLNGGTSDTEQAVLIDADLWRAIEGDAAMAGRAIWGVDLGTSAAQSAVAAYWPETGALRCLAAFPQMPSLAERGLSDGVGRLYEDCAARGELLTLGARAVDVSALLQAALSLFGRPAGVCADRWRESELRDALDLARVPQAAFISRGQGYKDGGEDVRAFRKACAGGSVTPLPSKLLRSAMAEARTISDPAGNSKLAKSSEGGRRQRARDDAAAAAILAVAAGTRQPKRTRGRGLRTAIVR